MSPRFRLLGQFRLSWIQNLLFDKAPEGVSLWAHMGPARALEESVGPARALEEREKFRKNAPLIF